MVTVYSSKREKITLSDKPFAKGGEGSVYKIVSAPSRFKDACVKIYHSSKKTQGQESRIKYMVNNPPQNIRGEGYLLGWPLDWVTDAADFFLGFVMPLGFPGSKELVNLTVYGMSKKIRNDEEWRRRYDLSLGKSALIARLKLICNIAIPVHILHSTGKYVLEDFKPQNVLITKEGRVTIVDMDSVQIASGNSVLFPGTAATPEYLPPEYYNQGVGRTKSLPIQKSWDNFAIGIVFYQLLLGIHPYSVIPKMMPPDGNCGPVQNVPKNLFPFGPNSHMVASYGDPHKNFLKLPKVLRDMFIRTFSDNAAGRPDSNEWGRTIHQMVMAEIKREQQPAGRNNSGSKFSSGITITGLLHPLKVNGKYGYVDDTGRTFIDFIWNEASDFSEDLAYVKNERNLYGYINKKGDVVIPCTWKFASNFVNGQAKVTDNKGDRFIIDKKGNVKKDTNWCSSKRGKLIRSKRNGKYGFLDEDGNIVIDFIWNEATEFSEELSCVRDNSNLYGFINKDGDVVIPCIWKSTSVFIRGKARVKSESDEELMIDRKGNVISKTSIGNGQANSNFSSQRDNKKMSLHNVVLWLVIGGGTVVGLVCGGFGGLIIGFLISMVIVGFLSEKFPSFFKVYNK